MRFLPGQSFDCGSCTKCCRGWRVAVDAATELRIRRSSVVVGLQQETGRPALEQRGGQTFAAKRADGGCIFLADNLCSLHADLGAANKPWGCRLFPFRLLRTPDGVYVGVSFCCPAVQQNRGRPLEAHARELEELASILPLVGDEPLTVEAQLTVDWSTYRILDEFLAQELAPTGSATEVALGRALWAVAHLVGKAGSAARRLSPVELSEALAASAEAVAPPNEPLILMERHHFGALVSRVEAPSPGERAAFQEALMSDKPLSYRRFLDWRGRLTEILRAGGPSGEVELRRYLRALVFRKFLVARRPVLHNLALLYLAPLLFRFWSGLSRLSRAAAGSIGGDEVDCYRALNDCDHRVFTHPREVDEIYAAAARGFVDNLD